MATLDEFLGELLSSLLDCLRHSLLFIGGGETDLQSGVATVLFRSSPYRLLEARRLC